MGFRDEVLSLETYKKLFGNDDGLKWSNKNKNKIKKGEIHFSVNSAK